MDTDLISELRQTLAASPTNVVVLIGAGVSMGALRDTKLAAISSWAGLLRNGLARCKQRGWLDAQAATQLREHLASDDAQRWILAAEAMTNAMGSARGGEFRSWLADTVGQFADASRPTDVLEALAALSERGVILATVNYDGILEKATGLPPITWRQRDKVEKLLHGTTRGILHLHGHWDEPESVVLGDGSYQAVAADEHARTVMAALRMTKTWVFLGHGAGLRDPNWGPFLRWTETVFAESPHHHYRLACDHELDRVRAEHPIEQRIIALRYGEDHDALGPFLTSLVPAAREAALENEGESCVILRINVGENNSNFITEQEARSIVDHPNPTCLSYDFGRLFDRKTITPRQWRSIARGLDRLVERAKHARKGATHFVIVARAPLPVFAYLGARMYRYGKISVANDFKDGPWELYGPHLVPQRLGRDDFEHHPPKVGSDPTGKLALVLRSAKGHSTHVNSLKRMVEVEGDQLVGCYEIVNDKTTQYEFALTNAELSIILAHAHEAIAWRSREAPRTNGLVFALACPNWLAFFLTNTINPNVVGRMDFPNWADPARGYLPALSWRMEDAPWVMSEPRVMVMCAEPMDATRTAAGLLQQLIRDEFERVFRRDARVDIRPVSATGIDAIIRELEDFRPDILHIHLHGSEAEVSFVDHQGDEHRISAENFIERLQCSDFEPTVIVLTACQSASFAESLCGIAECVIAMVGEAEIKDALDFSRYFYAALARGKDLARAIRQGQVAASRQSVVHFVAGGVVLQDITLFPAQLERGRR